MAALGVTRKLNVSGRPCVALPAVINLRRPVAYVEQRTQQVSQKYVTCLRQVQVASTGEATQPGPPPPELDDVDTCQEAIDLGIKLTTQNRWTDALLVFERALTLPGTGVKRFRDKPRAPSDSEQIAALFNIACCHSKLGDIPSGLVALGKCMELGYLDFAQIRKDPDLEVLRQDPRFEEIMKRFEPKSGGFWGIFGGGKK